MAITLIEVVSGTATAEPGLLDLVLRVRDGGEPFEIPFGYAPDDPYGLTPEVGAWLGAHPEFSPAPYEPPAVTKQQVYDERDRRLASGFSYDFGDVRGVHKFGTSDADMKGWDRVTKLKDALLAAGDTTTTIRIATKTGTADVTALEWNAILLYEAQNFEQPLWQASFLLESMAPIPADYADDSNWPS